jgi:hypothetical protein
MSGRLRPPENGTYTAKSHPHRCGGRHGEARRRHGAALAPKTDPATGIGRAECGGRRAGRPVAVAVAAPAPTAAAPRRGLRALAADAARRAAGLVDPLRRFSPRRPGRGRPGPSRPARHGSARHPRTDSVDAGHRALRTSHAPIAPPAACEDQPCRLTRTPPRYAVIAILALAMGMRNAAVRRLAIEDILSAGTALAFGISGARVPAAA